tara:strand:- start:396 stop:1160 length:765 start_codon:yes stop_codon:yes gene_type:complete
LLEQSILLCKSALEKLRNRFKENTFNNVQEEIEFYKKIKPQVVSYLIFYGKRLHIESKRVVEGRKEQIKYFKRAISELQVYFNNNLDFYHYYKSRATHLDEQYFLRENKTIRINVEEYYFFTEDKFSTSHDGSLAIIMAYVKLIEYLKNEIKKLNNTSKNMEISNPFQKETQLNWSGNNSELVELIYALHTSGIINNGNADIKKITNAFEGLFNTDLGNYYQSFNDIRNRKINRTKFMDKLKTSLVNYMHELDN